MCLLLQVALSLWNDMAGAWNFVDQGLVLFSSLCKERASFDGICTWYVRYAGCHWGSSRRVSQGDHGRGDDRLSW